jgi:apolipoprotein N-acyltransferase
MDITITMHFNIQLLLIVAVSAGFLGCGIALVLSWIQDFYSFGGLSSVSDKPTYKSVAKLCFFLGGGLVTLSVILTIIITNL